MMLDYDEGKYTMDELRSQLIQLMPDLAHCEMLMIHSSSSCIYKKGDVPPCTIKGGIHTYIIVDQGIHIPQVGERLKYAAWQLGHGYHKITKNGKLLPRHLLDDSVYAPERLIFESFPIIGEGIEIRERQFNYWPGGALSTQNTSLSESERRQLNHTISDNRLGDTGSFQSFTVSGDATTSAVPEPLTILGAMTPAGFGAVFKRRLAKSLNKDNSKDED
jgi:hypothetical protein